MNLESQFAQLEAAQLVRRAEDNDPSFQFRHALTQEAAYGLLLLKQRRELHRQVAQSYEELYAEQLDRLAAPLAQHYTEAGDDAKALTYFRRAGDAAARVYANAEALLHYTHALELARRHDPIDAEEIEYLYRRRGRELELASQFKAALASYEEMERFAREYANRPLELSALIAQCQILCTANSEFNPEQGEPFAQRALDLSRELGDRPAESKIQWILLNLYRFTNRFAQAREAGEQSLEIARELSLREQAAFTLNDLPHVYHSLGDPARSEEALHEAIRQWRELGNLPMLADGLATVAMYDSFSGNYDRELAYATEANQISETIGNLWGQTYSLSNMGNAYWAHGEAAHAIQVMEETLRLSERSGYLVPLLITRADLAFVLVGLGAYDQALEMTRLGLKAAETYFPSMRLVALTVQTLVLTYKDDVAAAAALDSAMQDPGGDEMNAAMGQFARFALTLAQGEYTRVIDMAPELLERIRRLGLRSYMVEALYLSARAQRATGNASAARDLLAEAQTNAEQMNLRRMLWKIYAALGAEEAERGNDAQAKTYRAQAREIVNYIADHAPPELRGSFLNLPDVRAVMEAK